MLNAKELAVIATDVKFLYGHTVKLITINRGPGIAGGWSESISVGPALGCQLYDLSGKESSEAGYPQERHRYLLYAQSGLDAKSGDRILIDDTDTYEIESVGLDNGIHAALVIYRHE